VKSGQFFAVMKRLGDKPVLAAPQIEAAFMQFEDRAQLVAPEIVYAQ